MRYEFRRAHKQFAAGDPVPGNYTPGVIATMLEYHIIKPVPSFIKTVQEPEQHKAILDPPQVKRGPGRPKKHVASTEE